jgi:hypothetical protein
MWKMNILKERKKKSYNYHRKVQEREEMKKVKDDVKQMESVIKGFLNKQEIRNIKEIPLPTKSVEKIIENIGH